MTKATVFYKGQIHKEYLGIPRFWTLSPIAKDLREQSQEFYNGCYILITGSTQGDDGWYTADGLPVLDKQVPKELRLYKIIST